MSKGLLEGEHEAVQHERESPGEALGTNVCGSLVSSVCLGALAMCLLTTERVF